MRRTGLLLALAGTIALTATHARAEERSPFQLLTTAKNVDGAKLDVTPVRIGAGWRGYGYYPGAGRPYGNYYRGYNYYRPYSGYNRYYNGYRGYYGGYYQPYYYGNRPYYGGYWRY